LVSCEKQQQLSDDDKKILEDAHKNKENPDHPAHPDNPEVRTLPLPKAGPIRIANTVNSLQQHGKFMKGVGGVANKLGGAAIFGAGATAGSDAVNGLLGK